MKKRVVSLLLIATMLISLLPLGISAATQNVDGTVYTVVATPRELAGALAAGGNILLKNDIVLDSSFAETVTVLPGTVLNGNGYTLTYADKRRVPLFCFAAGTKLGEETVYIKNLCFGTMEAPFTMQGETSLFTEADQHTCFIIYQNVDFYVKGSPMTGARVGMLYTKLTCMASFYGCSLHVDLSSSTMDNLVGGWIGEISGGDLVMTNCTTFGSIKSRGLCTGAFVGQGGGGNSQYNNCTNYADVTASGMTAGFVGNVGTGATSMYFTACTNYGTVTTTGTGYEGMAGGIMARTSNRADQDNKHLRVFYDCVNYGTIKSGARAGGIVGSSHDHDTGGQDQNYAYTVFGNCVNYGSVTAAQYAGGIMGIASPATLRVEITDCINTGAITSKTGYAGNVAGMLCAGVISGGYAAGVVDTKLGTDPLVPQQSGMYTMMEGAYTGKQWAISAPSMENVRYIGNSDELGRGVTRVTSNDMQEALADMKALCGVSFVQADANDATAYVVAGEPILRGVQQSVTVTDGKVDLRFAASLNANTTYQKIGFRTVVHANGTSTAADHTVQALYTSINCNTNGREAVNANALAGKYICTVTLKDIPLDANAVIEVTPYAIANNGTEYAGKTRVISCENGVYRAEALLLDGKLLSDYVIVYATSNKCSERLLATRMSDEIAKLTGVALPVLADTQATAYTNKIMVGNTKQTTVTTTGRVLCTQGSDTVIVIKGDNTAQLSEAITYFIDTVGAKVLADQNVWSIDTTTAVPTDTQLSIMAFNMGAKDKAAIKQAEWELIVDYLPDILTCQEPWAGFLDDFLNDYAVQPTEKFKDDPSDDDIMSTDVNNKCFTGNGYYGVYWGLPRWVPGDPCTNGKASYSVILYAKERFTVDVNKSGTFWLTDTVNVSGSAYTGSNFSRCATYATMTDLNTGKTFTVVNVHLDTSASVRVAQVQILLRELQTRVGTDMPIIITGDMNAEAHSEPIKLYKNNDIMPMTAMDEVADRSYRSHRNIDWLLVNHPEQMEITYYNNCRERTFLNNYWNSSMIVGTPSDHPAIYAEFKFR